MMTTEACAGAGASGQRLRGLFEQCREVLTPKRTWALFEFLRVQYELMVPSFVEPCHRDGLVEANVINCMAVCILDDIVDLDRDLYRFESLQREYINAAFGGPTGPRAERPDPCGSALFMLGQQLQRRLAGLPGYPERRGLLRFELAQGFHSTRMQGILGIDLEHTAPMMLEEYEEVHANSMFLKFTFAAIVAASPSIGERSHALLRRYVARVQAIYVLMYDTMNYASEVEAGELCNVAIHATVADVVFPRLGRRARARGGLEAVAHEVRELVHALVEQLDGWVGGIDNARVRDAHRGTLRMFANHELHIGVAAEEGL